MVKTFSALIAWAFYQGTIVLSKFQKTYQSGTYVLALHSKNIKPGKKKDIVYIGNDLFNLFLERKRNNSCQIRSY